jgi:hypothetical protein
MRLIDSALSTTAIFTPHPIDSNMCYRLVDLIEFFEVDPAIAAEIEAFLTEPQDGPKSHPVCTRIGRHVRVRPNDFYTGYYTVTALLERRANK